MMRKRMMKRKKGSKRRRHARLPNESSESTRSIGWTKSATADQRAMVARKKEDNCRCRCCWSETSSRRMTWMASSANVEAEAEENPIRSVRAEAPRRRTTTKMKVREWRMRTDETPAVAFVDAPDDETLAVAAMATTLRRETK